jgi:hypothetical protein
MTKSANKERRGMIAARVTHFQTAWLLVPAENRRAAFALMLDTMRLLLRFRDPVAGAHVQFMAMFAICLSTTITGEGFADFAEEAWRRDQPLYATPQTETHP